VCLFFSAQVFLQPADNGIRINASALFGQNWMIPRMGSIYASSLTKISLPPENITSGGSNQAAQTQREGSRTPVASGAPVGSQGSQSYRVTISEEALRKAGLLKDQPQTGKAGALAEKPSASAKDSGNSADGTSASDNSNESRELESLKQIDRNVRAHEQAHVIAGGSLVRGAASFGYATGPDGKLYAVSGEVSIDSSPVPDDPAATVRKMIQVTKAALAPAQPSGQDRSVASAAMQTQVDAQREVTQQATDKTQGKDSETAGTSPAATSETKKPNAESKTSGSPDDSGKAAADPTRSGSSISSSITQSARSGSSTSSSISSSTSQPGIPKQTPFQGKHINIQA
jgi:hypothetical protein